MQNRFKRIFSGSAWGILTKVLDALAKFVTIPLLVGYYGKADYGLIALAFSLNAYLRLMDLGFNVGAVRFFSMWNEKEEWDKIKAVSQSSMVFYGVIGLMNAVLFVWMAHNGDFLFDLTTDQVPLFRQIMYLLAFTAILNWLSNVIVQLLSAGEELGYVNRVMALSSLLHFGVAVLAVRLEWPLVRYFTGYLVTTLIPFPFYLHRLRIYPFRPGHLLRPRWHGSAFREILTYSLAIFAMGVFQLTANELRPLLLSKFAGGTAVLTDYRVMQTIAMLIIAFGGTFLQVLLPAAAKIHAEGDPQKTDRMVFGATRYISIFLSGIVFLLIANAENILIVYMGPSYAALSPWLILWLLTVLLSMHNTPVASMVLSTGKTRFLVYSSAIACIVSVPVTIFLAAELQAGAAVIGYLVYMLIQIGFYYVYYIPRILRLDSGRIFFRGFLPAAIGGTIACLLSIQAGRWFSWSAGMNSLLLQSLFFVLLYGIYQLTFVLRGSDINYFRAKLSGKGTSHA